MKNDFDLIKEKFEKDSIPSPNGLEEEDILEKLSDTKQKKKRWTQNGVFKGIMGIAACLVVGVICFHYTLPIQKTEEISNPVAQTTETSVLEVSDISFFNDYSEIKKTLKKIGSNETVKEILEGEVALYGMEEKSTSDAVASEGVSSYAETYKQVDNVDEGDILKNDGTYLYYVKDSVITIYRAKEGKTKAVSTIEDYKTSDDDNDYTWIEDIFVKENRLIVNVHKESYSNDTYKTFTETAIYDLSTITKPKKLKTFKQSGGYQSSRMIGDQLYVISNDGICENVYKDVTTYVPCVSEDGEKETTIEASDIAYIKDSSSTSYLVVSSIDTKECTKVADTNAVLGYGGQIYCNENNLYITQQKSDKLQIIKVKLGKDEIQFTATGKVAGSVYNQFAMDEKDGYLRIATTSQNKKGKDVNNLYVLDENLKVVGKVTGFAKDESIQAVRYIDDKAYVITYEQTDPLFIIDLSNPTDPEITGSVKITGFSSLLVPVDENTLLGIGYSTEETELGEATDGIKFALFDISDSSAPKILDSEVMEQSYSNAQWTHKALVVNTKQGYYAIPYNTYDYENDEESHGVVTLKVVDNDIVITNTFKSEKLTDMSRCTYIDDYLYGIDYTGTIVGFKYSE